MRWIRTMLALGLGATATTALADMLVVRSVGPSVARYKPGQKLAETARVTIASNDQLVLLDAKGIKTLRGPGTFVVSAPAKTAPTRLSAITGSDRRRERVGAVRAPGAVPATRPDIWDVDAGASGTTCLTQTIPTLWRASADAAGTSTITAADGRSATLSWLAGQATQSWPADLPVADGARYRLTGSGSAPGGTAIEVKLLRSPPDDVQSLVAALIAARCQAQVDSVIVAAGGN